MNREDIQKLIGGYATGSLTDEERHILFEAALDDQELFDTLQQEQALKDLFDDPFSREQVRRAAAESLPQPRTSWFRKPWLWASASSAALAGVLVFALVRWDRTQPPPVVKQPVATSRQPAADQSLPDRDKSAAEPTAPKPSVAARKPPAGNVKTPAVEDTPGRDFKESTAGHGGGGGVPARRASGGFGRSEESGRREGISRTTSGENSPSSNSVDLSKNREGDSRVSVNERKGGEKSEPPSPPPVNSRSPVNSAETARNSNGSPRNTAEEPRNSADTPRITELPRKDDQVAQLPSSQSQLDRGRSQSGPSQIQQPQQVQAPPPASEFRIRTQAGQMPAATSVPNPASRPGDSEGRLQRAATVKTEATDEMMKAKTSSPPKSKDAGGRAALAKKSAPVRMSYYSLARRSEDGSYSGVSADTIVQPGETVRLTIVPRVAGLLSIEVSDAYDRAWKQVFPADGVKVGVTAQEAYAVPLDIVVAKDQRLRVKTGSDVIHISIKTGAAVK